MKINSIGGWDMTIRVPPQYKHDAFHLSESVETVVFFDVKRDRE